MAERFLTSVQASQLLGVNVDTMRRYLREGKVRALRLGKDWKIPESSLSDLARGGRLAKGGKPIASTFTNEATSEYSGVKAKARQAARRELEALAAGTRAGLPPIPDEALTSESLYAERGE